MHFNQQRVYIMLTIITFITALICIFNIVRVKIVVLVKKINQFHYRSEVARGFQEVKVPRLRDNGPGWW